MTISEILKTIELTDEQVEALDDFFAQYTESVVEKTKSEMYNEIHQQVSEESELDIDDVRAAFQLFKEDCVDAFALFENDAQKAFALFENDAEKAFELGMHDIHEEASENMTKALQDLYEDIEERVKADFMESKEFKAIEQIKRHVTPLLLNEDQKALIDELEKVRQEKAMLEEEKSKLDKEVIVETLLKDFPEEYYGTVKKFISAAITEEEIYERFNTIVDMFEAGAKPKDEETEEPADESEEHEDAESAEEEADEQEEGDDDPASVEKKEKKSKKSKKDDKEEMEESVGFSGKKNIFTESIFNITNGEQNLGKPKAFSDEEEYYMSLLFPQMAPRK